MQVQALEDYLRVPLLRRNGRQVELTPQGALLRPKVEQALADLERAIDEARADRGSGPLRVTTIASFLAQWLLPRLPDFTSHHAGIDVQIHTSTELVDFVKTGMDAAIRFGAGTWPRLHVQKLFDEWLVPVCTPALLQRHGPIAEARDLKRYRLLHSTYEPWTAWLLEGGPDEVSRPSASGLRPRAPDFRCHPGRWGTRLAKRTWFRATRPLTGRNSRPTRSAADVAGGIRVTAFKDPVGNEELAT